MMMIGNSYGEKGCKMKQYTKNNINIIECAPSEFSIVLVDRTKKNVGYTTYVNAGFFGNFSDKTKTNRTEYFTLPVGNLACDVDNTSECLTKALKGRGSLEKGHYEFNAYKFNYYNQFYNKETTMFVVNKNGVPSIGEYKELPDVKYGIVGVPIMRNGNDVIFNTFVRNQGWDSSTLYATKHTFLGMKQGSNTIYIMGTETKTNNMISSGEAYRRFKALGFYNVIKLDGGGSYFQKYNGKILGNTSENRQINTVIKLGDKVQYVAPSETKPAKKDNTPKPCPYAEPNYNQYQGKIGVGVRWVQWFLNQHQNVTGMKLDVDGIFGANTKRAVLKFQKAKGLAADGIVGVNTRRALKQR